MKRLHGSLALIVLLSLSACSLLRPGGGPVVRSESAAPLPTATGVPPVGAPQIAILSPLHVDSRAGHLYATGQVNGQPKLLVLDAADGRLLAAWDTLGQLALDAARNRLVVDGGRQGVSLLDATTGEVAAVVALPAQDGPPAPQIDAETGLVYAFRAATVYTIDPATAAILEATPLTVAHTVCDEPAGDAPIYQTAYDPTASRLYLSFISYNCIPWVSMTLVAYDGQELTELGRHDVDIRSQFAPHDGQLFGASVSRLGPTAYWAWDGAAQWAETNADFIGPPTGIAVDGGRGVIYEALGETLRVIEPNGRVVRSETAVPLLAGSALAAYDSGHDQLYFVSPAGRLSLWPAANLFDAQSPPLAAPSALPAAPVTWLALSPNWHNDNTMLALVENECAAAGGGLFVLLDPAAGWQPATTPVAGACQSVTAAAFSPDYAHDSLLFAATAEPTTVLRSVDGGRSWTAAESPFPAGVVRALLPSPTYGADQTLFALLDDGALYRSRDGGRTWRAMAQPLDRLAILDAAGPRLDLFGARAGQLLRSDDGETWTPVGPTPNAETLLLLSAAPSSGPAPALYAFTAGGKFARSLDGGLSWAGVMETSAAPVQLAVAVTMPDETRPVFLLHQRAIVASYDGMSSIWAATAADEAGRYRPTAVALPPDFAAAPFLFVGTVDGQVLRVRADALP